MSTGLDERYFDWLYYQVCSARLKNPKLTYRNLLYILYTKEFVWLVPNDDNRADDGKDLRYEYLSQEGVRINERDSHWLDLGCSMFELLIGISRRLEFETEIRAKKWFWELLDNIELAHFSDALEFDREEVDEVLDRVIWRTYEYNGGGGLFPLIRPETDQRKVELWYQLSSYILERGLL